MRTVQQPGRIVYDIIIIYNYFAGKILNFYFTEGSQYKFGLQSIMSVASHVLKAKLVKGTRGKVKILISPNSCFTQFYRLLDYQENEMVKNPQLYNEKSVKIIRICIG